MVHVIKLERTNSYKQLYLDEKKKRESLETKLKITVDKLEKIEFGVPKKPKPKGSLCSVSGKEYERKIHYITKYCYIDNTPFNIQTIENLAGSSSKFDIVCNYKDCNIGIEAKKYKAPDWMQCSIECDKVTQMWTPTRKCKNPVECSDIFCELMKKK